MIEVAFIHSAISSTTVRRRTFNNEAEYQQWLSGVRYEIEVVTVRPVAAR